MAFSIDRPAPGLVRLTVGDDFLTEDAWQVHEILERTDRNERVELDFRRVRACGDFALSLLARDILRGTGRLTLLGTTQHQERVLSYFGVDPSPSGVVIDVDPN